MIPIRFKTDLIFKIPDSERFRIATTARDTEGNKSNYFNAVSIKLSRLNDLPNAPLGDLFSPFYKWNGWGGKELEVSLIWTHHGYKLEDTRRIHRVKLKEITHDTHREWLIETKDGDVEITNDGENQYEVRDLSYNETDSPIGFVSAFQFKLRRFDRKPLPWLFSIEYHWYYDDDHLNYDDVQTIYIKSLVPTWWLVPMVDLLDGQ